MRVVFQNPGLIDLIGVRTFGVNAKLSNTAIGYFGTGLKYAIAVILREGGKITLWRGTDKYEFTTRPTETRGKSFNVVYMNDEQLGFTTELGKNWKMWQAFRELYCNASDENGETLLEEREVPLENVTTFAVQHSDMEEAYYSRAETILATKPLYKFEHMDVHPGHTHHIYYRGIRVFTAANHFLFTYNLTERCLLTEDRTWAESWSLDNKLSRMILPCQEFDFIKEWLSAPDGSFEHEMGISSIREPSPQFLRAVEELKMDGSKQMNRSALKFFTKAQRANLTPDAAVISEESKRMLAKAADFAELLGFPVRNYPIIVVPNLGEHIWGLAEDNKIFLSELPFLKGTESVCSTLIEEYLHLSRGLQDESRGMQNYLFDTLIKLGKELHPGVL